MSKKIYLVPNKYVICTTDFHLVEGNSAFRILSRTYFGTLGTAVLITAPKPASKS